MNYTSIEEIKEAHEKSDGCFFSERNMKAWKSKIYPEVYHGCLFVTSEKTCYRTASGQYARAYSVRRITEEGSIETIGELGQHGTLREARRAAQKQGAPTFAIDQLIHVIGFNCPTSTGTVTGTQAGDISEGDAPYYYNCEFPDGENLWLAQDEIAAATPEQLEALATYQNNPQAFYGEDEETDE